jgi:hypothetical protein
MSCTKHLVAMVVIFVLTYNGVCQGQQLDVVYTTRSGLGPVGSEPGAMMGEKISVGVRLRAADTIERGFIDMKVHISPTIYFDDGVVLCDEGYVVWDSIDPGEEINISCEGLVPSGLGTGWYYLMVEYDYAPYYPIVGIILVIRGGGTGACCTDGGGCWDETQAECECDPHFSYPGGPQIFFTTYQGEGTMCLGDLDGDIGEMDDACQKEPLPPTGACCVVDIWELGDYVGCQEELTLQECLDVEGGNWMGVGTSCAGVLCPDRWACCHWERDDCQNLLPDDCRNWGGIPKIGSICEEHPCEEVETEACCWVNERCTDIPPSECLGGGGWPQGPGSSCPPTGFCEQDTACCYPSSGEICRDVVSPQSCIDQGGYPVAEGVMCSPGLCDPQACCYSDGTCLNLPPYECTGTPLGLWSQCSGDTNGDGWDDACLKPPECLGDLNGDGSVSLSDRMYIDSLLMQVGYPYRIYEGDSLWDASADLNGDGVISLADRMVIDGILMQVGPPYISPC